MAASFFSWAQGTVSTNEPAGDHPEHMFGFRSGKIALKDWRVSLDKKTPTFRRVNIHLFLCRGAHETEMSFLPCCRAPSIRATHTGASTMRAAVEATASRMIAVLAFVCLACLVVPVHVPVALAYYAWLALAGFQVREARMPLLDLGAQWGCWTIVEAYATALDGPTHTMVSTACLAIVATTTLSNLYALSRACWYHGYRRRCAPSAVAETVTRPVVSANTRQQQLAQSSLSCKHHGAVGSRPRVSYRRPAEARLLCILDE